MSNQEAQSSSSNKIQRLMTPIKNEEDENPVQGFKTNILSTVEPKLRPQRFKDYPGQTQAKENLRVYVDAALKRGSPLDHVVLHGPPGLGKTTLAHIIANELGVDFQTTSGPSLERPGDLAGILASMTKGSLLFIDEIHRLPIQVEEVLYSAMEDFSVDLVVGQGQGARTISMPIEGFTLVGATTKLSHLSRPFLSRFGIQEKLEFYDVDALQEILLRSASILGIPIHPQGAFVLAERARGTPRIANRLLRRTWDFAGSLGKVEIDPEAVDFALSRLDIDEMGLEKTDRMMIKTMQELFNGGPVGIESLAVSLGEDRETLEEVYEPYLVYKGYIRRTSRGRQLTEKGIEAATSL